MSVVLPKHLQQWAEAEIAAGRAVSIDAILERALDRYMLAVETLRQSVAPKGEHDGPAHNGDNHVNGSAGANGHKHVAPLSDIAMIPWALRGSGRPRGLSRNFLSHVVGVRYAEKVGAGVLIKVQDRTVLLTARQVLNGLLPHDIIALCIGGAWERNSVKNYAQCAQGSDVCAVTIEQASGAALSDAMIGGDASPGEVVHYCGFPIGVSLAAPKRDSGAHGPLVRSAVFSGEILHDGRAELLFEASYMSGFAGAPVVRSNPMTGAPEVLGFVSHFRHDLPSPVLMRGNEGFEPVPHHFVHPTTGFLSVAPIRYGLDAARIVASRAVTPRGAR